MGPRQGAARRAAAQLRRREGEAAGAERRFAAAAADFSARGAAMRGLAQLSLSGPAVVAQQRRLAAAFGPAAQLRALRAAPGGPAQRLVVNTGSHALAAEIRKPEGWIVAKDVYIALKYGGMSQQVVEFAALGGVGKIGKTENVYLQGHGSAGKLGALSPATVASSLKPVLPAEYAGRIYSLSCSAGVAPKTGGGSGVEELARSLNLPGMHLEGAHGVALNHPEHVGAHRVIDEDKYDSVDALITRKIREHGVNGLWDAFLTKSGWSGDLSLAAEKAAEISRAFYVDLEGELEDLKVLLPTSADTTVVTTS